MKILKKVLILEPISNTQMNDVCSATVANARRLRAPMGWSPSGANQRRRGCRAAQILRTEAIMSLSGVPSGRQGFQPGTSRRALLKTHNGSLHRHLRF